MKCLLCQKIEANQTGSHIFTNSLVKSCLNVEGKTGRDDELIFSFNKSGERDVFVGRDTSTDKINQVLGRDMTEEDLESNSNKIVVDNIYCKDCEELFGKIESPFTDRVLNKIRKNGVLLFKEPDNVLIRLYFYIQIWRASSFGFENWSLGNKGLEEHLRNLVLDGCKSFDSGLPNGLKKAILKFPLVVNYLETPLGDKSSNLFFIPKGVNPFYFFLCDFIIEFFPLNNSTTKPSLIDRYGVNDEIKEEEINLNEKDFIIRQITNDKRKDIKSLVVMEFAKIESERMRIKCITTFQQLTGNEITQRKLDLFKDKFFDFEEVPIAIRWSDKRFSKILNEVIESD
jgi:hypothetical protein